MQITSFDELVKNVQDQPKKTIALAVAEDKDALIALNDAHQKGIADGVLVGDRKIIREICQKNDIDVNNFDIIHSRTEQSAVIRAVQLVRERLADTLMKGKCSTATLLRVVLDKKHGIRSGKLLSHVAAFDIKTYPKILLMTDGGMNIAPDIDGKIGIIENAVFAAKKLGILNPKVALIAAIEKVNHKAMQCTIDAAVISKMYERGQLSGAIVDGPLALDNAIDKRACEIKGIISPVAGDADIVIMPSIESGNVFYKALTSLSDAKGAGVVFGAKAPIVLTSRSDTKENKFMSIAFGIITSAK